MNTEKDDCTLSDEDSHARQPGRLAGQVPYVCVYASQVAACIGKNKHKRPHEAMLGMWQRIAPVSFKEALRRNNVQTEEDIMDDLVQSKQEVRALVDRSLVTGASNSIRASSGYLGAVSQLQECRIGEQEKQLVDAVLKKNWYTAYGSRVEKEMLRHIRDVMCISCHADPTFYKARVGEVDGVPWFVGGKIDAISNDGHLVIEIKNRVNRLFHRVPIYEQVQVQTYLELLDVHQGLLVECFKGDSGNVQTDCIAIARSKRFWNEEVISKLTPFVTFLIALLKDPAKQDAFLQSKHPSAMIGG